MNACEICPDKKKCPKREAELPRSTKLSLSKYEESHGNTKPHYLTLEKEVGLYSGNTSSGDACRVIQELTWGDGKYLRLGYYVRNPDKGTWRWGQSSPLIQENEYKKLLNRARKTHIMT
jgi:hypothetical protein